MKEWNSERHSSDMPRRPRQRGLESEASRAVPDHPDSPDCPDTQALIDRHAIPMKSIENNPMQACSLFEGSYLPRMTKNTNLIL